MIREVVVNTWGYRGGADRGEGTERGLMLTWEEMIGGWEVDRSDRSERESIYYI